MSDLSNEPATLKEHSLLSNIWWAIKLSFKEAPVVSVARFIGTLRNNTANVVRGFVVGLIIDWSIRFVNSNGQDEQYLWYGLAAFAAYYFGYAFLNAIKNYGYNLARIKLNQEVSDRLILNKLENLSVKQLEKPTIQNLINRYKENGYVYNSINNTALGLLAIGISFIGTAGLVIQVVPLPTLVCILASIPVFLVNRRMIDKLWQLNKTTTELSRRSGSMFHHLSTPAQLKEIKLIGGFRYLFSYFEKYVEKYIGGQYKIYNQWIFLDIFGYILMGCAVLLGVYQLIELAADGDISTGQIAFYLSALTSVNGFIDNFASSLANLGGASDRLSDIRKLLEYPEPDESNKVAFEPKHTSPRIELKHVSFAYPGSSKKVLKNLDLEIKPGEKIAIVGANGAGKSTLVKLITNIYQPQSGRILVDNQDLAKLKSESWYNQLGVLYQDFNQYSDLSAFENIAVGKKGSDHNKLQVEDVKYEEIKSAAKMAGAHEFIMDYDNNYSQILSEQYEEGIRPSGGQWQRLAIARFFYRDAPVLILDEPTAAIDAEAEAEIFNNIYEFVQNKTVIIISHRFSTVRNADRILVMEQGQITENGTHEELVEKDGTYARAFRTQAKGYQ